uniref:Regulator of microtubule dynamics protein 1 n=1 Tax=Cacopsylla melanoneura TaxID=428564 RepID=A0A8D8LF55_9HEMI
MNIVSRSRLVFLALKSEFIQKTFLFRLKSKPVPHSFKSNNVPATFAIFSRSRNSSQRLYYPLVFLSGLFSYKKMSDATKPVSKISEDFLKKVDDLFEEQQFEEVDKLLDEAEDKEDVEIIWRQVRVKYQLSQHSKSLTDAAKKDLILGAYFLVYNALPKHEDHYAIHKWLAVVLNEKATFEGTKARIQQLETIKHHMNKAIELKPDDSTTQYMLGMWCFEITDMPWYQRKIANAIFDTLPTSSYDEALKYFLEAEKQHPLFYSQNVLMLGKTYMRLENYEQAAYYLEMTKNYPVKQDKDQTTKFLEEAATASGPG